MTELEMLTPREKQVYARRMAGEKNPAIAATLRISLTTVAVTFRNAKARIKSGVPARGQHGNQSSPEQVERHRNRMRQLARGKRCPVCRLRGKHECLAARAREIATDRSASVPQGFPCREHRPAE